MPLELEKKVMKEESRKSGFLVNRYGLLAVLGLGCSFMGGTGAYASAAPAPAPAGRPEFKADALFSSANGIIGSGRFTPDFSNSYVPGTDATEVYDVRVFMDGKLSQLSPDKVRESEAKTGMTITGKADSGSVVQLFLEEGKSYKVTDTKGEHIMWSVPVNDVLYSDIDTDFDDTANTGASGVFANMKTAYNRAAARKYRDAIEYAIDAEIAEATAAAAPNAYDAGNFNAIRGIIKQIQIGSANAGFKTDAENKGALEEAWNKLVDAAADAAGSPSSPNRAIAAGDGSIGTVGENEAGGGALAYAINKLNLDATTTTHSVANATAIYAALVAIDARITMLTGIGAGESNCKTANTQAGVLDTMAMDGSGSTAAGTIDSLRTEARNQIIDATSIDNVLAAVDAAKETAGKLYDGGSRATSLAQTKFKDDVGLADVIGADLNGAITGRDAAFTALKAAIRENSTYNAVFVINPGKIADDAPGRTFLLQFTQNGVSGNLDLSNGNGSGNLLLVKTDNMSENDTICIVSDVASGDPADVRLGNLYYDKLEKKSKLLFVNEGKVFAIDGVEVLGNAGKKAAYENLTVQVIGRVNSDVVLCLKDVYTRKLILGAEPNLKIEMENGDELKEQSPDYGFSYFIPGDFLATREGVDVLAPAKLETHTLHCGGDIGIAGNASLMLAIKNLVPCDYDKSKALNGSGDGHVGIISVKGNLRFSATPYIADSKFTPGTDIASFKVINDGDISYHNYIVVEGGTAAKPRGIELEGIFQLTDGEIKDVNGIAHLAAAGILAKINGDKASSQLILVKENSHAKITGIKRKNGGGDSELKLDLHGDHANEVCLIRLEKGAFITLDPITIDAGDHTAIDAGDDGVIRFLDTDKVTLTGNIKGNEKTTLVFVLSDPEGDKADAMLAWNSGTFQGLADGQKVNLAIEIEGIDPKTAGRNAVQAFLAKYLEGKDGQKLQFITLASTNKDDVTNALADQIIVPGIKGVQLAHDDDGNLQLNFADADVPDLQRLLGGFGTAYLSDGFAKMLNNTVDGGAKTAIERGIMDYIDKLGDDEVSLNAVFAAFNKTTTEEKNRTTLTFINSARETVYSKMGQEFFGDKHYSVWASGFGDIARNGSSSAYKMKCDVYGFTAGADWRVSNNLLVGAFGGYGKAKAKYSGDVQVEVDNVKSKCDFESYFGGIYGMWDEFVKDICVKFSLMAGHGKYDEQYILPSLVASNYLTTNDSQKGHWISGNVDCTYKHWNVYGINVGPWVSLSAATVHQKSSLVPLSGDVDVGGDHSHFCRHVAAADRRSIEAIIGVAADYDFTAGVLELAMGYKHEFQRLKDGKVSLYQTYNDGNYKGLTVANAAGPAEYFEFDAFNVKTGKDSFVAKVSWNMKFGDFGLAFGGHGQCGNHFRDIAGSITASYSF